MALPSPTNHQEFDPATQQDPVRNLTLLLRGLRIGEAVRMPGGTMVRSTAVMRGSSQERRFSVIPAEDRSTPEERHKAHILGYSTYRSAEEAAKKAISKD